MVVRRKAFFGAVGLAVFITICTYGLDRALPYWLYALVFAVSASAIYGFTGKLAEQKISPDAALNGSDDKIAEP